MYHPFRVLWVYWSFYRLVYLFTLLQFTSPHLNKVITKHVISIIPTNQRENEITRKYSVSRYMLFDTTDLSFAHHSDTGLDTIHHLSFHFHALIIFTSASLLFLYGLCLIIPIYRIKSNRISCIYHYLAVNLNAWVMKYWQITLAPPSYIMYHHLLYPS